MEQEIMAAFTARKYAATRVDLHARNIATVYLSSKEGVTAGTLYKRFADCTTLQIMGNGYVPAERLYTVMVRITNERNDDV